MKKRGLHVVAVLCILVALATLLDQFLRYGYFLELNDILHHESFAFVLIAFALGIIFATTMKANDST